MRSVSSASSSRRKWVLILSVLFLAFVVGGYTALFASIHAGVTDTSRLAMTQYPGNRVEALCALVDCESCSLSDRNHAVWALGQLRDRRALPILEKYFTGQECNHSLYLCQYELRKAVKTTKSRSRLWLGYRDVALR